MLDDEFTVLMRLPEHVLTNYCYTMLSNIWGKKIIKTLFLFFYMIRIHLMNGISLRVLNKQVVKYIFFIIRTCIVSQIYILIMQYIQNNTK